MAAIVAQTILYVRSFPLVLRTAGILIWHSLIVDRVHSINDETVPYENASRAKNKWKGSNIQYSLGYYGGHVITCVRFIYAVQTLLINEEKEEGGHYEF